VPFAPGGGTDSTARIVAQAMSERLGQPVSVDNRAGAGGAIGMAAAAQAPADGYTLVMGHVATHVVNMAVHRNPGYDTARDFVALGITSTAANILVVNPQRQAGIRTAQDFVAACRAKPGELSYGSAGVGSPAHITTALFLRTAGVEAQHVPYRGGAPATTDLVAGNLDFMFSGASDCIPHIPAARRRRGQRAAAVRRAGNPDHRRERLAGLLLRDLARHLRPRRHAGAGDGPPAGGDRRRAARPGRDRAYRRHGRGRDANDGRGRAGARGTRTRALGADDPRCRDHRGVVSTARCAAARR
jgi:hypothetical protein